MSVAVTALADGHCAAQVRDNADSRVSRGNSSNPRYDIAVTNDGQSSLEKMGLAPVQIQRAAGLSAGPRGQAERPLPKQRRGSVGLDPHLHHPLLCPRGKREDVSFNQCRNCNATPIRQEQKKREAKFCAALILD